MTEIMSKYTMRHIFYSSLVSRERRFCQSVWQRRLLRGLSLQGHSLARVSANNEGLSGAVTVVPFLPETAAWLDITADQRGALAKAGACVSIPSESQIYKGEFALTETLRYSSLSLGFLYSSCPFVIVVSAHILISKSPASLSATGLLSSCQSTAEDTMTSFTIYFILISKQQYFEEKKFVFALSHRQVD